MLGAFSSQLVSASRALAHFEEVQESLNLSPARALNSYTLITKLDPKETAIVELIDRLWIVSLTAGRQLGVTRISDTTSGNGYRVGNIDYNGVEQTDLFRALVDPPATPAVNVQVSELAATLSSLPGVTASASSSVTLSNINAPIDGLIVNGSQIADSADIPTFRLNLQAAGFVVGTPAADPLGVTLTVTSGSDIVINTLGMIAGASIDTVGTGTGQPAVSQSSLNNTSTTTGGVLMIEKQGNVVLASSHTLGDNVWGTFDDSYFSRQPALNVFKVDDPDSYNATETLTIYDSLGIAHELKLFFVKEPLDPEDEVTGGLPNTWSMYAQVDGEDIGGSYIDAPSLSRTILRFNQDGILLKTEPEKIMIVNWTPSNTSDPSSSSQAAGPNPFFPGINDPSKSSNFEIHLVIDLLP